MNNKDLFVDIGENNNETDDVTYGITLKNIKRYAFGFDNLNIDEAMILFKNAKEKTAREKLFDSYSKYVIKIVSDIYRSFDNFGGIDFDDFLQEAMMKCMECILKFNPESGSAFSTYLASSITNCCISYYYRYSYSVRISESMGTKLAKVYKVMKENACDFYTAVSTLEYNSSYFSLLATHNIHSGVVSLDAPIDDEDDTMLIEKIKSTEPSCEDSELYAIIRAAVLDNNLLTSNQREILIHHYYYNISFESIANKKGISPQAAQKSCAAGLKKLAQYIEDNHLIEGYHILKKYTK